MKNRYPQLVTGFLIVTLVGCKRELPPVKAGSSVLTETSPVVGTNPDAGVWLETKLRCYSVGINGALTSDTTYTAPAFTDNDYLKFTGSNTCTLSADYIFNGFGKGYPILPANPADTESYTFTKAGTKFLLTNPQPALTISNLYGDTLSMPNPTTMLIHTVYLSGAGAPTPLNFPYYRTISDAYYIKSYNTPLPQNTP